MRRLIASLCLMSILAAGVAWAQPFTPNEAGVTMGHWHLNSRDVEVNKKILEDKNQKFPIRSHHVHYWLPETAIPDIQAWYAKIFGAKPSTRGRNQSADVPGANLTFSKTDQPTVPTKGRILDHIGFDVTDLQAFIKKLEV